MANSISLFDFFCAVEDGKLTPEVMERATTEKEKILADREKEAKKRAEKAKVNDPLKKHIMDFLTGNPSFASVVGVELEVSTSKASYLLRDLEADGFLTSEMAKAPGAKTKSKKYTVVPGKVFEVEVEDEDESEDETEEVDED